VVPSQIYDACEPIVQDGTRATGFLDRLTLGRAERGEWVSDALLDDQLRSRLHALVSAVQCHAEQTCATAGWKELRSRLTGEAEAGDCSYRKQVAALFEAAVLGVAVRQWGRDVELWPAVPGTHKRCDLRVSCQNVQFFGEAKGMWKEEDRCPKRYGMRPVQAFVNGEVERLLSTIREAQTQLPSGDRGVCFALCRHLQYPGMYPLDTEAKREVYGRVVGGLQGDANVRVDVVAVFHGWACPDWLTVTSDSSLEPWLRQAFDSHWPHDRSTE